uniref:cobalamin-dependent protein n=1 Tax=uncultured Duncaniella sp. TaxID=2768039 RepID=UPI0026755264
ACEADIICMSAMLTTTMAEMKKVIGRLVNRRLRDRYIVMVGGAPVSQHFAEEIGADGYSDNANSAVKVARKLVGAE